MKEEKFRYCPSCGEIDISNNCFDCNRSARKAIKPKESRYSYQQYIQEAERRFGDPFRWLEVFETDELIGNPEFNLERYNTFGNAKYHLYLCPVCAKHYNTLHSREEITCGICGHRVVLYETTHNLNYYHIKSMVLFGDFHHHREIIIDEELSGNSLFDREEASKITQENAYAAPKTVTANIPKCPTCQSTRIKRISNAKRSLHAFAFGIFSKTAQSQFECENCGYKW